MRDAGHDGAAAGPKTSGSLTSTAKLTSSSRYADIISKVRVTLWCCPAGFTPGCRHLRRKTQPQTCVAILHAYLIDPQQAVRLVELVALCAPGAGGAGRGGRSRGAGRVDGGVRAGPSLPVSPSAIAVMQKIVWTRRHIRSEWSRLCWRHLAWLHAVRRLSRS